MPWCAHLLQQAQKFLATRNALVGIFLERRHNKLVEIGRDTGHTAFQVNGPLGDMGLLYGEVRISYLIFAPDKGRTPSQHLIEHAPHTINIAAVIEAFGPGNLFWAHVCRCSNDLTRASLAVLTHGKSNAKID